MYRLRALALQQERIAAILGSRQRIWWIVALVGWWLSPITAWNDAFTNIPLALGTVWILRRMGIPLDPEAAVAGAYILTNVAGILLLWLGVSKLGLRTPARTRPGWFLRAALRMALYAVLAWALARLVLGN